MALFPTTAGVTQNSTKATAHNTATGYPTSESVGSRQSQSNKRSSYPPPPLPPQRPRARNNDPLQASLGANSAPPPKRSAPPSPEPNEHAREDPTGFQFAPRTKEEDRVEGRPHRGRSTHLHDERERRRGGSRVISNNEIDVQDMAEPSTGEAPKTVPPVRQRGASMGPPKTQTNDEIQEMVEERPRGQRTRLPQETVGDTDQQRDNRGSHCLATNQSGDDATHSRGRTAVVPPPSVGPSQDDETDSEQRSNQNINYHRQTTDGQASFSNRTRNRSTINLASQSGMAFGADTARTAARPRQRGHIPSESQPPTHGNDQYQENRHRDGVQSVPVRGREEPNEKAFEGTDRDEPMPLNATSVPRTRGRSTIPVSHPPGAMPGERGQFPALNHGDRNSRSRSHAHPSRAVGPAVNNSSIHSSHNIYREGAGGTQRAREQYGGENVFVTVPSESSFPENIVRSKSVDPAATGPTEALFRNLVTTMKMESSDRREEKTKLATATERIYELQDLLSESHARIIAEKEKNEEFNQIYNNDVDTLKERLSDQTKKSLIFSRSAEGMFTLQDGRIARLQSLNEEYESQMVTMRSETESLAKRLEAFKDGMIEQRKAVNLARDLKDANEKLQKGISDDKSKKDLLDKEIAALTQAKDKACEEQQATKERSDKDAVACWVALTGKLPSDRIDSLKLNKASPLEEIVNLLNSTYSKHVKDAKSLATAQHDLKTLKASYQAGCDAIVELCKVIHVEAPDQSTPSFLKGALHTSQAVIEQRQLELKETTRRFENAVKEKAELTRQLKELTNAKSLAEAERDDLRLSVGKTQEELAASSDKAKTIITLQKELKGSTEKVDDFKKKLSASKEEEQKLRTQLVVARGEKEQALKAKQDQLEAVVEETTLTIAEKDKQIASLTSQAEKNQEIAKSEKAKIHGIGVSAAAANAEAAERLKKELEAERARHLEDEVLERYKTDKSTPAERALIEKVRGQTVSPAEVTKDAEKIAEVIWKERVAKAENEVNKLKKMSKKWEDKYTDLHATLANKVVESEASKGKDSRQAKTISRIKTVSGSNSLGPAHMKKHLPVPDSQNNSDEEDEVQEARSKKQSGIVSRPPSPVKGKKKAEARATINTEFSKASEHPEVQDKIGKRPASPEANRAEMSAYKKTRFGELPQSSDPPPGPYSGTDELMDDDETLVPTQNAVASDNDDEYTPATQSQAHTKSKASSSNVSRKRGKSMASIDAEEDEDEDDGTSSKPAHSQVKKMGSSSARQKTAAPKRKS